MQNSIPKESNTKLNFGQFIVKNKDFEGNIHTRVIGLLSQEDMAKGWKMIIPKKTKKRQTYHNSIFLYELPPHLWNKVKPNYNDNTHYRNINDKIYNYSIKISDLDNTFFNLFKQVTSNTPDKNKIIDLYNLLNNNDIKSWILIRAKHMIKYL